jgi:hypothetical protein
MKNIRSIKMGKFSQYLDKVLNEGKRLSDNEELEQILSDLRLYAEEWPIYVAENDLKTLKKNLRN